MVVTGTAADLVRVAPLIRDAHRRMASLYSAETTFALLPDFMQSPNAVLLIEGEPPYGYCLAEVLLTKEIFVHQVYLKPGTDPVPMHQAILAIARDRQCGRVLGITFRHGGVRGFAKYGVQPVGILIAKGVE